MKYLRYLLYVLLIPVAVFLFILIYGTLSDYKPDEQILLSENLHAPDLTDSTFNIMIWNIGYCGLGEKMDFFYDGGKGVRPEKEVSQPQEEAASEEGGLAVGTTVSFLGENDAEITGTVTAFLSGGEI